MEAIKYFITYVDAILALYTAWLVVKGWSVKSERIFYSLLTLFFMVSAGVIWWK